MQRFYRQVEFFLRFPRITEPNNGWGWNGHLQIILSNLPLRQGHLEPLAQDHAQAGFDYLQGRSFHNLSEQPVPALGHPHSEKVFPDVRTKHRACIKNRFTRYKIYQVSLYATLAKPYRIDTSDDLVNPLSPNVNVRKVPKSLGAFQSSCTIGLSVSNILKWKMTTMYKC